MTQENKVVLEDSQTSYLKGRELEEEFAAHMKKNLGWTSVRVGAHMKGKENSKGASIDVIGECLDERGVKFHRVSMSILTSAIFMVLVGITLLFEDIDGGSEVLLISIFVSGLAGFFLWQSDVYHKQNAWVECKNLKGKATISMIDKSLREKRDYIASGDKEYKFEYHYFVSASGFVENALKHAVAHGMFCFEKKDGKFVEIKNFK